jgi:hypothetical protein
MVPKIGDMSSVTISLTSWIATNSSANMPSD